MAKRKEKKAGKKKLLAQKPAGKKKETAKEIPAKGGVFASFKKTLPTGKSKLRKRLHIHQPNFANRQIQALSNSEKLAHLPALAKPFASLSKAAVQKNVEAAHAPKQEAKTVPAKAVPARAEAKFASTQELAKSGVDTAIIFYPLITEKAVGMIEAQNKLCFVVSDNANKASIKKAIETMYGVKIRKVNIVRDMKGRKKAIVKLEKRFKADEIAMKLGVI